MQSFSIFSMFIDFKKFINIDFCIPSLIFQGKKVLTAAEILERERDELLDRKEKNSVVANSMFLLKIQRYFCHLFYLPFFHDFSFSMLYNVFTLLEAYS